MPLGAECGPDAENFANLIELQPWEGVAAAGGKRVNGVMSMEMGSGREEASLSFAL